MSELGLPLDASAEGWRIDHILHFANYAALTLGAVALVWLGIVLVRDRKHKKALYTHGQTRAEKAIPLALAAMVFLVVDGYLLFRSTTDLHSSILRVDEALAEPGALRVQINARQWAWDVRYPGSDDRFGTDDDIYTVGQLVIPEGRAVVFELAANDVVHSFYLPNFRIKQDAIPGTVGQGWFRAARLGSYEIACAQHCGVHHYQMRGTVDVLSEADFTTWRGAMSADALRVSKEDLRALAEEPSRGVIGSGFLPEPAPTRDWAWAWGGAE
jgi:cytochrome c oxidase subunit 2